MVTEVMSTSARTTRALLDRLIIACHDDDDAQRACSTVVGGGMHRSRLEASAASRTAFADELSTVVRSLGGVASARGSLAEHLRAAFTQARTVVVGPNAGDAYTNCERIEGLTERLYERTLEKHLPHTIRQMVARQHAEIAADRIELRRRSFGG